MSDFAIRDMVPTDEGFVLKSWITASAEFTTEAYALQVTDHTVISQLLNAASSAGIAKRLHGSSCRLVACDPENPDSIFGFIIGDRGPIVHYAFVKYAARKMGIATALLHQFLSRTESPEGAPIRCTHWGFQAANLAPQHSLVYDPMAKVRRDYR